MSDVLIPNEQLLIGTFLVLENAQSIFDQSKLLYNEKKFQGAISLATIVIEESLKGIELIWRFKRNDNLSKEDWKKLTSHKHKLTHVRENAAKIMETASKEEEIDTLKELEDQGFPIPKISREKIIENTRRRAHIHSRFQDLRQKCFYVDWNESESQWGIFSELTESRQDSLAFFVIGEAETELELLYFFVEKVVNTLRKNGITAAVPYPKYMEYRTPDQFESIKKFNKETPKLDQVKFNQGYAVMQKIISLGTLENVSFGIFSDTMGKYLKIVQKQEFEEWFPHPLVKALMIALQKARDEGEDGKKYAGVSGDADLTPDQKPRIVFFVGVGLKSGIFTVETIASLGREKDPFSSDVVEKILRTEIIIERQQGKDITIPIFIESLSTIGIKSKMIRMEEISDAIRYTKQQLTEGKIQGIKPLIMEELRNLKGIEEWDKLNPNTRALIASTYGHVKHAGYNFYITPSPAIEKWKARIMIMQAIDPKFLETV